MRSLLRLPGALAPLVAALALAPPAVARAPVATPLPVAVAHLGSAAAAADSVVLAPVRDATIFEGGDEPLASGAGPGLFAGKTSRGAARRVLLAFDVAGALPAGARVTGATLELHVEQGNGPPSPVALHRLRTAWGEGPSSSEGGRGAPARAGDATWTHAAHPDRAWTAPGGDFDPAPSAVTEVGAAGVHAWRGTGLVADVQALLDHPGEAAGWILVGDESAAPSARRFASRETALESARPVLTITYEPRASGAPVRLVVLVACLAAVGLVGVLLRARSARSTRTA